MNPNPQIKDLLAEYRKRRPEIRKRLRQFSHLHKGKDEDIFQELSFCILTANANALHCDKAVNELRRTNLLFEGLPRQISPHLRGRVRFHNKKADFIVMARRLFGRDKKLDLKSRLDLKDVRAAREWLVEHIKGYGYKEASHFLRNIGLGHNIAILDRHILKNLKKYGVIKKIPDSLSARRVYMDIEDKMRSFSKKTGIPMDEMDLLFWSIQTGFIFK